MQRVFLGSRTLLCECGSFTPHPRVGLQRRAVIPSEVPRALLSPREAWGAGRREGPLFGFRPTCPP
jgi:hypothetical protein